MNRDTSTPTGARFGRILLATISGALFALLCPGTFTTDALGQGVWINQRLFVGAATGGCLAILIQAAVALWRGRKRAWISVAKLVELALVALILGGFAQNWQEAKSRLAAREERMNRYSEAVANGNNPQSVSAFSPENESTGNLASSMMVYVFIAAYIAGGLVAVYRLIADITALEMRLPVAARNAVALTLVGAILVIGVALLLATAYAISTANFR